MAKQSSKTKLKNKHQNKQAKGRKKKKNIASGKKKSESIKVERQDFNNSIDVDVGLGLDADNIDYLIDNDWMGRSSLRVLNSEDDGNNAKKRRTEFVGEQLYEHMPRILNSSYLDTDDPTSGNIQLLPIKSKQGLIHRSRPGDLDSVENHAEEEAIDDVDEVASNAKHEVTMLEIYAERERKMYENKSTIATLCEEIVQNSDLNINCLKKLLDFTCKKELVAIRRLAIISLCEIFQDIAPGYRIRPLSEKETSTRVSKDVRKIREFEEALIANYHAYLNVLEELLNDFVGKKPTKRQLDSSRKSSSKVSKGLAVTAANCMAELLTTLSHFNYRSNLIVTIVSNLNLGGEKNEIGDICNRAVKELFRNDSTGEVSLEAVKVISRMAKTKMNHLRPQVLETLMCLNINSQMVKEAKNRESKIERLRQRKEDVKKLSRKEKKRKKLETQLDQELQETEAVESRHKIQRFQTEILKCVFVIYFRVLKQEQKSPLLTPVLRGLSKHAHLISVDFFHDLVMSLKRLISSGELALNESLNCVLTALKMLSGQGEALNIDPHHFYLHLYNLLVNVGADCEQNDFNLCVECLDVMLLKRRKQVSLRRILGFLKRTATVSLQLESEHLFAFMSLMRGVLQLNPKCDLLLDNDNIGRGVFQPELADPEHCNAESTTLWELSVIGKHYSVDVRDYGDHLLRGAPSHGAGALPVRLVQRKQIDDWASAPLEYYFPAKIAANEKGKKSGIIHWLNTFAENNMDGIEFSKMDEPFDYYKCIKAAKL